MARELKTPKARNHFFKRGKGIRGYRRGATRLRGAGPQPSGRQRFTDRRPPGKQGKSLAIATGYGSAASPDRFKQMPRIEKPFDPWHFCLSWAS
jgi:hypothetical protein